MSAALRRPIPPARWSLQRRLVVGILALLAIVSLVVGTASVLALNSNLMARLDQQVTAALRFASGLPGELPGAGDSRPGRRVGGILYAADDASGVVRAQYTAESGNAVELTAMQQKALTSLTARDGQPTTVDLGGQLGAFRVAQVHGSGGALIVVGQSMSEVTTTTTNLILIFALVTVLALIAAGLAVAVIVRTALRPLGRVAATATRVAQLRLDRGEVALAERVPQADTDPRTEVGQVGSALNRMLGHVEDALVARQASENKVRQFVADASHELRTPLASIRGYSELTRRGGHELPADVVRSIGRIESESIRMTSLVEDLLLLARLDAGRELVRSDVDLVPLLADAVGDAHAASPDHEWRVELPEEPVLVHGDGARLHQVVANLLANARAHTPAGTTVTSALRTQGSDAVLTIADDGPGIAPELIPVLFERFARGDSSRSRAAGSTGLGLAIVAAVVEGHAGSVAVRSVPGDTRFTVRLPLHAG
ncbi:MAG TPA: ATP-binding protein [Pseudolysinimonas sp.]|nr:ATP-binding protein [Pseudolysinimonas sp.]